MREARPDPKPRRRVRTREGVALCRAKVKADGKCRRCGRRPSGHALDSLNAAHLIGGRYREWVPDAVIPMCGSGTTGCHHEFDNHISVRKEMWPKLTEQERDYVIGVIGPGNTAVRFGIVDLIFEQVENGEP